MSRVLPIFLIGAALIVAARPGTAQVASGAGRSIFSLLDTAGRTLSEAGEARGELSSADLVDAAGRPVQVWQLSVPAGRELKVNLHSNDFDARLLVVGAGPGAAFEDDDSGDGLDAQLCFTVPDGAGVRVVVTSTDAETGAYSLSVLPAVGSSDGGCLETDVSLGTLADVERLPTQGRTIDAGRSVTGTLDVDEPEVLGSPAQAWAFQATANTEMTFDLQSSAFDAYMIVVGPELDPMTDDDGGSGCNARITATFPQTGLYRIVVSTVGVAGGAFTLSASANPSEPDDSACGRVGQDDVQEDLNDVVRVGVLSLGEPATGRLTGDEAPFLGAPAQAWTLEGRAGQRIAITLASEDMDSFLFFEGPGFDRVADDDDGGGSNSRLCVQLGQDGAYTVVASRYSGSGAANYTLRAVTDVVDGLCDRWVMSEVAVRALALNLPTGGRTLAVGQTVSGELLDSDVQVPDGGPDSRLQAWRLVAAAGTTVWVDLFSEEFDPVLAVLGPSLEQSYSDDYDANGWNSRLEVTVPQDGDVRIFVGSLPDSARGRFQLRATIDPPPLELNGPASSADGMALERLDPAMLVNVVPDAGRPLEVGLEIDGTFDESDVTLENGVRVKAWTLTVQAGDLLVFEIESDPLDPIVYVSAPGLGDPVVDDDGGPGSDARLELRMPESGTCVVYAGSLSGDTGEFRLRVVRRRD